MKKIKIDNVNGVSSLHTILKNKNISLTSPCGGTGRCGKCKVRILNYSENCSDLEKRIFTSMELADGWRLACKIIPSYPLEIEIPEYIEDSIKVSTTNSELESIQLSSINSLKNIAVCIDIGTTTLAAALIDTSTSKILNTSSSLNHQRIYGADVISRIQASNCGAKQNLKDIIYDDIKTLITGLLPTINDYSHIPIVISGNTTMLHLLLGYSCENLGKSPYSPVNISLQKFNNVTILPGISTFVGSDIVSGICFCGMDVSSEVVALIDLGTNGEMAIGNKDKILVTSTAAGPAFEGGNISCGVASIPGAIHEVSIINEKIVCKTLDNKSAIGICGTGVVEIVSELLVNGLIDESGLLSSDYFQTGFPIENNLVFTQNDVREVQLAKSAIRAGLETLAHEYGIAIKDIKHLYIAGGFGQKINILKASSIGMIPYSLINKSIPVGNSSLYGAIAFASNENLESRMVNVANSAYEINLASNKTFNNLYIDYMAFEEI